MFPYPSGALHMGHVRVYTISDTLARYHRARGESVLHPMGWDAFGLPAENAAIERGLSPVEWTQTNISQMRQQLNQLNFQFDWEREVTTCRPDYYRWTQWLFTQLYRHDLAYQREAYVNWDPVDGTVLANEQVDAEGRSWRSGARVERRRLNQWFVRLTHYREALLKGLAELDWPEKVKQMQRHWIGRAEGYLISFQLQEGDGSVREGDKRQEPLRVFTTSPEKLLDTTFLGVSREHALSEGYSRDTHLKHTSSSEADCEREGIRQETVRGELLPVRAVHPITGELLPVLKLDHVVQEYGTGVVMGVPARNKRDARVAEHWGCAAVSGVALSPDGTRVQSGDMLGMSVEDARGVILSQNWIQASEQFRLRDWLISRQRYWGCPIPMVHCPTCGTIPVPEQELPVLLPTDLQLTGRGSSPLRTCQQFTSTVCPQCGSLHAQRETDTMDTFIDSSWYYMRYCDPQNGSALCGVKAARRWLPVDTYIGGIEHAVLHLLYARFVSHFLYDLGVSPEPEPFRKLITQGMVTGKTYRLIGSLRYIQPEQVETGAGGVLVERGSQQRVEMFWEKMSKSKYNGVNPQVMVEKYGADVVRLFLLFKSPPHLDLQWDETAIVGIVRWRAKLEGILAEHVRHYHASQDTHRETAPADGEVLEGLESLTQRAVHVSTQAMTHIFNFNSLIAQLMKLTNYIRKHKDVLSGTHACQHSLRTLLALLHPMAPHISTDLWSRLERDTYSPTIRAMCRGIKADTAGQEHQGAGKPIPFSVLLDNQWVCTIYIPLGVTDSEEGIRQAVLAHPCVQAVLGGQQPCRMVSQINQKTIVLITKE
ncbi:Leucine--tRNA ligase [Oopsacas minuta]|uniref:leucine--tRNA ligase n=1 Tax=Oopsacas minuta TaxID=111878 RepID=A0AAV7JSR8_9METZ|nr:Leucine--tRNA ligase [Oopsacas minuta]